ncbi:MAG: hypothetical protein RBS73_06760 [Prolixibacteraceae bacterium]|jgi:hypothetical protein|nr:hypothetical protein [Prolixibacteraceae bacterium]
MEADRKAIAGNSFFLIFILLAAFGIQTIQAQTRWVEDRQMNFKINIPVHYKTNQLVDGSDKIHVFVSPDENLVVRVRAIPLSQQISDTQLQSIFEQNIIQGAVRINDELTDLNGLPARWSGYSWVYNNVRTVLANYYIVRQGMAYVVWAIVAENQVDQKTVEMSNILGSFTLINGHPRQNNYPLVSAPASSGTGASGYSSSGSNQPATNPSAGGNSSTGNQPGWSNQTSISTNRPASSTGGGGVKVASLQMGGGVNNSLDIIDGGTNFPVSEKQIHLVFDYQGNTNGQNFQVKWFSKTHNCLVVEDDYLPTANGRNRVHSFIDNAGNAWPLGDYRAEVWCSGQKLAEKEFSVGGQQKAALPAGEKLLGECYADGKGDNYTKSLGGRYLTVDLNQLKDDDVIEVRIKSGILDFVHVHYRTTSGVWHDAYHGMNTRFIVKDLLAGKRGSYTHLVFNVNAQHEKYLSIQCYADVWLLPPGKASVAAPPQQKTTASTSGGTSQSGGVKQIVLDNQNNGYDFKTGKVRDGHQSPDPDVLNEPWCTTNPALCGNWAKTGKSRMEDVKSAPVSGYISDGKSFIDCQECPVNEVLAFKLKDGSYGKLMITKDEKTQTNNGCQHRITCLVEYPAFK